jgi:Polyketide cyclase / dehydrase and lipid transport
MALNGHGATVQGIAPASPTRTFDVLTPIDPSGFYPRFRVIPAVASVTDQTGDWDAMGQTRTLHLSDRSTVVETITDVDRPSFFAYELTDFTKLFGLLVDHARAEWRFEPAGTSAEGGTRITWSYTFFGRPGRGWIVGLIVRLAWAAYMRRVIVGLVDEVSHRPPRNTP